MFDQVFFGLMALTSLVLACALTWRYPQRRQLHAVSWAVAAIVLCVAGLLLALKGLAVLSQPYVPVIAAVIPSSFAIGVLLATFKRRAYGICFFAYAVLMIALLSVSKVLGITAMATTVLIAIHAPSGIIIFVLPFWAAFTKRANMTGGLLGLGGLLIGVGGMALATLGTNAPILPASIVLAIIAPLLFSVSLLFTLGILSTPGWGYREASTRVGGVWQPP
jgi:hypothetical protein